MTVLAIDPGTRCGWAASQSDRVIASGIWNLTTGRFAGGGMRYLRFRRLFIEALESLSPDLVAFEEVRRHLGTDAAHVYGGIVGILTAECEERGIPYQGYPVGAIKKLATGKGNAPKDAMLAAARARWPDITVTDDNQADALWIAVLATADAGTR
jgi:Holliday junction resolvasome RuvABC endonuclease subunit